MIWTPESLFTLRTLWNEGLTTSKIAEILGTTKGSVVGKVNRLKLTPRPNPSKPRIRLLNNVHTGGGTREQIGIDRITEAERQPVATVFYARKPAQCCWPVSDGRPWIFCDGVSVDGRSYCAHHQVIGYVQRKSLTLDD